MMEPLKDYSDIEYEKIFASLHPKVLNADVRRYLCSRLSYSAIHYQRQRRSFDEYHRRHDSRKELLESIEAIENLLAQGYQSIVSSGWKKASDREVFEEGVRIAETIDDKTILWAQDPYAEITRRTLDSLKARLVENLDYVDPFAAVNRERPAELQVAVPAKNDKRPERTFVASLADIFCRVHKIDLSDLRIGNDPGTDDFLRFARASVDPIAPQAFSDLAIRDHARATRKAAAEA